MNKMMTLVLKMTRTIETKLAHRTEIRTVVETKTVREGIQDEIANN